MSIVRCGVALAFVSTALPSALSEIVNITGATLARVEEIREGVAGDFDEASDGFPITDRLPLQVVARLITHDPNEPPAAAVVGAQFADPTIVAAPNPEEFALNLTLNSLSPYSSFVALAQSTETRTVRFAPGELSLASQAGDQEELIGTLFLDGALTILAVGPDANLDGARVDLRVTVRQVAGESSQTNLDARLSLIGRSDGAVSVEAAGGFPTSAIVVSDLSLIVQDFGVFQVLIIPGIEIDYAFNVTVGEPLDLVATVQVDARNTPGGVGVAAVIGVPTDALLEVIGLTHTLETATKVRDLLQRERETPTGQPAFPTASPGGLLGLCGWLGFESLLGLIALGGLRCNTSLRRVILR